MEKLPVLAAATLTLPILLLLIDPLSTLRLVSACMATTSSSQTAFQCVDQPLNTATIVLDNLIPDDTPSNVGLLGTCSCSGANAGSPTIYVYDADTVVQAPTDNPFGPVVDCPTISQLCVCDINGNCYSPYGTLAADRQVSPNPFCDSGGCFNYIHIFCTNPSDPNSGLVNVNSANQLIPCSSQFVNGNLANLGTGSPYFKGFYVGCTGCAAGLADFATCNGQTPGTFATASITAFSTG